MEHGDAAVELDLHSGIAGGSEGYLTELVVLLAECAARVVGAYTLPVTTMAWLGTVMALGALGMAMIAGGAAAGPIQKMIDAEAAAY